MIPNFVLFQIFATGEMAGAFAVSVQNLLQAKKAYLGNWDWVTTTITLESGTVIKGPNILRNGERDILAFRDDCYDGKGDVYMFPELKDWVMGGCEGQPPAPPWRAHDIIT